MPVKQPKKLLIMNILDILRKYSDEEHRLSQKDIAEILKTEYDMTADRKAIRRNILNLMDCDYNIEYSESIRMVPNPKTGQPEESYLWSDFYLERDFTDGELRLLIDSLLFSKHIPYSQCKELVGKLEGLSNVYFRSRVKHIARLPEDKTDNKQLFLTIELLDEAISRGRTLDLATYMKEHPYMYASDNVQAVFRVAKAMVSDVIDLFGTEVTFSDEDDAGVTVTAFTNEMAMEQFALNFAPDVTVLESQRLREKVKSALEKALEKYN